MFLAIIFHSASNKQEDGTPSEATVDNLDIGSLKYFKLICESIFQFHHLQ